MDKCIASPIALMILVSVAGFIAGYVVKLLTVKPRTWGHVEPIRFPKGLVVVQPLDRLHSDNGISWRRFWADWIAMRLSLITLAILLIGGASVGLDESTLQLIGKLAFFGVLVVFVVTMLFSVRRRS